MSEDANDTDTGDEYVTAEENEDLSNIDTLNTTIANLFGFKPELKKDIHNALSTRVITKPPSALKTTPILSSYLYCIYSYRKNKQLHMPFEVHYVMLKENNDMHFESLYTEKDGVKTPSFFERTTDKKNTFFCTGEYSVNPVSTTDSVISGSTIEKEHEIMSSLFPNSYKPTFYNIATLKESEQIENVSGDKAGLFFSSESGLVYDYSKRSVYIRLSTFSEEENSILQVNPKYDFGLAIFKTKKSRATTKSYKTIDSYDLLYNGLIVNINLTDFKDTETDKENVISFESKMNELEYSTPFLFKIVPQLQKTVHYDIGYNNKKWFSDFTDSFSKDIIEMYDESNQFVQKPNSGRNSYFSTGVTNVLAVRNFKRFASSMFLAISGKLVVVVSRKQNKKSIRYCLEIGKIASAIYHFYGNLDSIEEMKLEVQKSESKSSDTSRDVQPLSSEKAKRKITKQKKKQKRTKTEELNTIQEEETDSISESDDNDENKNLVIYLPDVFVNIDEQNAVVTITISDIDKLVFTGFEDDIYFNVVEILEKLFDTTISPQNLNPVIPSRSSCIFGPEVLNSTALSNDFITMITKTVVTSEEDVTKSITITILFNTTTFKLQSELLKNNLEYLSNYVKDYARLMSVISSYSKEYRSINYVKAISNYENLKPNTTADQQPNISTQESEISSYHNSPYGTMVNTLVSLYKANSAYFNDIKSPTQFVELMCELLKVLQNVNEDAGGKLGLTDWMSHITTSLKKQKSIDVQVAKSTVDTTIKVPTDTSNIKIENDVQSESPEPPPSGPSPSPSPSLPPGLPPPPPPPQSATTASSPAKKFAKDLKNNKINRAQLYQMPEKFSFLEGLISFLPEKKKGKIIIDAPKTEKKVIYFSTGDVKWWNGDSDFLKTILTNDYKNEKKQFSDMVVAKLKSKNSGRTDLDKFLVAIKPFSDADIENDIISRNTKFCEKLEQLMWLVSSHLPIPDNLLNIARFLEYLWNSPIHAFASTRQFLVTALDSIKSEINIFVSFMQIEKQDYSFITNTQQRKSIQFKEMNINKENISTSSKYVDGYFKSMLKFGAHRLNDITFVVNIQTGCFIESLENYVKRMTLLFNNQIEHWKHDSLDWIANYSDVTFDINTLHNLIYNEKFSEKFRGYLTKFFFSKEKNKINTKFLEIGFIPTVTYNIAKFLDLSINKDSFNDENSNWIKSNISETSIKQLYVGLDKLLDRLLGQLWTELRTKQIDENEVILKLCSFVQLKFKSEIETYALPILKACVENTNRFLLDSVKDIFTSNTTSISKLDILANSFPKLIVDSEIGFTTLAYECNSILEYICLLPYAELFKPKSTKLDQYIETMSRNTIVYLQQRVLGVPNFLMELNIPENPEFVYHLTEKFAQIPTTFYELRSNTEQSSETSFISNLLLLTQYSRYKTKQMSNEDTLSFMIDKIDRNILKDRQVAIPQRRINSSFDGLVKYARPVFSVVNFTKNKLRLAIDMAESLKKYSRNVREYVSFVERMYMFEKNKICQSALNILLYNFYEYKESQNLSVNKFYEVVCKAFLGGDKTIKIETENFLLKGIKDNIQKKVLSYDDVNLFLDIVFGFDIIAEDTVYKDNIKNGSIESNAFAVGITRKSKKNNFMPIFYVGTNEKGNGDILQRLVDVTSFDKRCKKMRAPYNATSKYLPMLSKQALETSKNVLEILLKNLDTILLQNNLAEETIYQPVLDNLVDENKKLDLNGNQETNTQTKDKSGTESDTPETTPEPFVPRAPPPPPPPPSPPPPPPMLNLGNKKPQKPTKNLSKIDTECADYDIPIDAHTKNTWSKIDDEKWLLTSNLLSFLNKSITSDLKFTLPDETYVYGPIDRNHPFILDSVRTKDLFDRSKFSEKGDCIVGSWATFLNKIALLPSLSPSQFEMYKYVKKNNISPNVIMNERKGYEGVTISKNIFQTIVTRRHAIKSKRNWLKNIIRCLYDDNKMMMNLYTQNKKVKQAILYKEDNIYDYFDNLKKKTVITTNQVDDIIDDNTFGDDEVNWQLSNMEQYDKDTYTYYKSYFSDENMRFVHRKLVNMLIIYAATVKQRRIFGRLLSIKTNYINYSNFERKVSNREMSSTEIISRNILDKIDEFEKSLKRDVANTRQIATKKEPLNVDQEQVIQKKYGLTNKDVVFKDITTVKYIATLTIGLQNMFNTLEKDESLERYEELESNDKKHWEDIFIYLEKKIEDFSSNGADYFIKLLAKICLKIVLDKFSSQIIDELDSEVNDPNYRANRVFAEATSIEDIAKKFPDLKLQDDDLFRSKQLNLLFKTFAKLALKDKKVVPTTTFKEYLQNKIQENYKLIDDLQFSDQYTFEQAGTCVFMSDVESTLASTIEFSEKFYEMYLSVIM